MSERAFSPEQVAVLRALEPQRPQRVPELATRLSLDQAKVAAAAMSLTQDGLVSLREEPYREWSLRASREDAAEAVILERRIVRALAAHEGRGSLAEVAMWSGLDAKEVGQALRVLALRGWARKEGAALVLEPTASSGDPMHDPDESAITLLAANSGGRMTEDELALAARGAQRELDLDRARTLLGPKNAWIEIREKTHRWLSLTEEGLATRAAGVESVREVSQLTPEMLATGEWRSIRFKPYDVQLATEPVYPGKRHPLQRVIEDVRRAFLDMGFAEHASPWVESGFWDFDALFQPQDHPAREMQDTFYVARPRRATLPCDEALVDRVRSTHENGGATGSLGWGTPWDRAKAEQNVLRTHTTAATIRALRDDPKGPRKVFSIGRVFRRETIDFKHLPIFFQVDGIILDERASFSSLLGTLGAFYERMGFSKYYFRPDFFPYTEPSVGVYIWYEERKDWIEMGGAGIFRPEVTEPLGCTAPVLAWGLGLDRLAMLKYGRGDIRDLYWSELDWLQGAPSCP